MVIPMNSNFYSDPTQKNGNTVMDYILLKLLSIVIFNIYHFLTFKTFVNCCQLWAYSICNVSVSQGKTFSFFFGNLFLVNRKIWSNLEIQNNQLIL